MLTFKMLALVQAAQLLNQSQNMQPSETPEAVPQKATRAPQTPKNRGTTPKQRRRIKKLNGAQSIRRLIRAIGWTKHEERFKERRVEAKKQMDIYYSGGRPSMPVSTLSEILGRKLLDRKRTPIERGGLKL